MKYHLLSEAKDPAVRSIAKSILIFIHSFISYETVSEMREYNKNILDSILRLPKTVIHMPLLHVW